MRVNGLNRLENSKQHYQQRRACETERTWASAVFSLGSRNFGWGCGNGFRQTTLHAILQFLSWHRRSRQRAGQPLSKNQSPGPDFAQEKLISFRIRSSAWAFCRASALLFIFYTPLSRIYYFGPVPWHVYLFAFHGTILLVIFEDVKKYYRRQGYSLEFLG